MTKESFKKPDFSLISFYLSKVSMRFVQSFMRAEVGFCFACFTVTVKFVQVIYTTKENNQSIKWRSGWKIRFEWERQLVKP